MVLLTSAPGTVFKHYKLNNYSLKMSKFSISNTLIIDMTTKLIPTGTRRNPGEVFKHSKLKNYSLKMSKFSIFNALIIDVTTKLIPAGTRPNQTNFDGYSPL